MWLDLLAPTLPNRSVRQGTTDLINCFLEKAQDPQFTMVPNIVYPTPGTDLYLNLSGSSIRGILIQRDVAYVVVDATVYKVVSSAVYSSIGTITTGYGPVQMVAMQDYIFIVDGVAGYTYQTSTSTFATITDTNFPNGTTSITYMDTYAIAQIPNTTSTTGQFCISNANDPTVWTTTDLQVFATADSDADSLVSVFSDKRDVYMFGSRSLEVWYDAGLSPMPFARRQGMNIPYGCAAVNSVARGRDNIYFLSASPYGQGRVCAIHNYELKTISPPPIDNEIQSYGDLSDAIGWVQEDAGHEFYILTFPTALKTLVYDLQTNAWHRRQSYLPSLDAETPYNRWIANCYGFLNGTHLIGDCISGKLYSLNDTTYTDNTNPIIRSLTTVPIYHDSLPITLGVVEVELEPGQGTDSGQGLTPQIWMRYSKDGGFTYSDWEPRYMGTTGQYENRVLYGGLGASRHWTLQFKTSDPVNWMILGVRANVDIEGYQEPEARLAKAGMV